MVTSRLRSSSAPPADRVAATGSVPRRAVTASLHGSSDPTVTRAPAAASAIGQGVAGGGEFRIDYAGNLLRLAGEMDEVTHADLVAALDRFADEPGDIHIDLAGVDFCDVACLRALVLLSHASHQDPDQPGRRVILHQPPAELKNLLQILGWDSAPGLVIDESPRQALLTWAASPAAFRAFHSWLIICLPPARPPQCRQARPARLSLTDTARSDSSTVRSGSSDRSVRQ